MREHQEIRWTRLSEWLDKLSTASTLLSDEIVEGGSVRTALTMIDAVGYELAELLGVKHKFETPSTQRATERGFAIPSVDSDL